MRLAIVGGNFLGCATAVYLRQALASNYVDGAPDGHSGNEKGKDLDEIVVFEQQPQPGGYKFATLSVNNVVAACGTAASVDVSSAPLLQSLLKDAGISIPSVAKPAEWSIFDWDDDVYRLSKYRSRFFNALSSSTTLVILLQIFSLFSTLYFIFHFSESGPAFLLRSKIEDRNHVVAIRYGHVLWLCLILFLAGGVVPLRLLFRLYSSIIHHVLVQIISSILYGAPSMFFIYNTIENFKEHLSLIVTHNSAYNCITLGHLLSACGLGKYVKQSTIEFFGPLHITEKFLSDCVATPMSISYGDVTAAPNATTNILATLLSLVGYCPVPSSARSGARYFSADETSRLCPSLLKAARAELRLGVRVISAISYDETQYDLRGIVDGVETGLGIFDAVLLAAVVDPNEFKSDVFDPDCATALSIRSDRQKHDLVSSSTMNTAKYVSLVHGRIKASFFRLGSPQNMPDVMYVLNSVNCSEVVRIAENVWRVTSAEGVVKNSSVARSLFEDFEGSAVVERPARAYSASPLRNLKGSGAPGLIIGRRFVNVAAIDRVCNDVNMDCIAARNAASFFLTDAVTWR